MNNCVNGNFVHKINKQIYFKQVFNLHTILTFINDKNKFSYWKIFFSIL